MARRTMLTAAKGLKTKKVRTGKVAQQLADMKHMGAEPEVKGKNRIGMDIGKVLNWYNYMCARTQAREYIETYLKSCGRAADIKMLKRVPDAWVNLQAGWYARIISRGGIGFEQNFEQRLSETLGKADTRGDDEDTAEKPKTVVTLKVAVPDRMIDKASDTVGELDELIDKNGWTIDVYDWLTKKQVTPVIARKIRDFFKPIADEAAELLGKKPDPQLVEGYKNLTKTQQKQRAAFYAKLITDCERFSDVVKKQKAPRKNKPVPVEKKLKGLKFQQESKEYKLVSIKPEKIIGASELWVINTRYRTLTVFHTQDHCGLDVKGTTMINYDEVKSKTYRIGRKTEQHIATALKGAKRAVSKMLDELKTTTLQHRIGENTILLRTE